MCKFSFTSTAEMLDFNFNSNKNWLSPNWPGDSIEEVENLNVHRQMDRQTGDTRQAVRKPHLSLISAQMS